MSRPLLLLAALFTFLYADQNVLAPNLTRIATDLGLDAAGRDLKLGGVISFSMTVLAALAALFAGQRADRSQRVRLLVAAAVVAELSCLATASARSWLELLAWRSVTGVGLGAAFPVAFSLLGDLEPEGRRAFASGVLWTSTGAGIILGLFVAGQIGPAFGWRWTFLPVALPGLLVALWIGHAISEPSRTDHGAGQGRTAGEAGQVRLGFGEVWKRPLNRWLFTGAVFEVAPLAVTAVFLADYLAQERGFSVQQASSVVGVFGLTAIAGKLLSGWLGDRLYRTAPARIPLAGACALAAAVPLALLTLQASGPQAGGGLVPAIVCMGVVGLLAPFPKPLVAALLLHENPALLRGRAFASYRLSGYFARAVAPLAAGALAPIVGRAQVLGATVALWALAAGCLWQAARALKEGRGTN